MKTAICGLGMVGGALERTLYCPILYDPPKKIGSVKELNTADVVFICVPTPYKNGFDISFVESVVDKLEGEKIVIIKSTVLPGTTDMFQRDYPEHKFIFNPEFLTEKNANNDMRNPDRQIIGYTDKSKDIAEKVLRLLPKAEYMMIIPAKDAEMIKYANNAFLATKVIFANQIYDLCEKVGVDYENVKNGLSADKRIGHSHLSIFQDGNRGYAGKCLPKDTKSLLDYATRNGVNLTVLNEVNKANKDYARKSI